MDVVVCLKQVVDPELPVRDFAVDPGTQRQVREGRPLVISTYDENALEVALQLKDASGAKVKVLTLGPRAAVSEAIRLALAMGADEAIVVDDPRAPELSGAEKARLPLLFLQPASEVLDRFTAVATAAANGLVDLTLTPRSEGDLKSVAVLVTPSGAVRRLVVLDGEGNRTTFTFTNLAPRAKRPLSDFALVPPKGTRVVGE